MYHLFIVKVKPAKMIERQEFYSAIVHKCFDHPRIHVRSLVHSQISSHSDFLGCLLQKEDG